MVSGARLLVDRLVPVETNVGPEQIVGQVLENDIPGEGLGSGRAQDGMHVERNLTGSGDEGVTAELVAQEPLELGLQGIEFGEQLGDPIGVKDIFHQEVAVSIVGLGLGFTERPKRTYVIAPDKILIERMLLHGITSKPMFTARRYTLCGIF